MLTPIHIFTQYRYTQDRKKKDERAVEKKLL